MKGQIYLAMIGFGWSASVLFLAFGSDRQPSHDQSKYFSVFAQLSRQGVRKLEDNHDSTRSQGFDTAPTATIAPNSQSDSRKDARSITLPMRGIDAPIKFRVRSSQPRIVVEDDNGNLYTLIVKSGILNGNKILHVIKERDKWYAVTSEGMREASLIESD